MLSFTTLEAIARADGEMVTIDDSKGQLRLAWKKGEEDRQAFDAKGSDPGESATISTARMRSLDADFRTALHECGKSASRESVRFSLSPRSSSGARREWSPAATAANC